MYYNEDYENKDENKDFKDKINSCTKQLTNFEPHRLTN